MTQVWLLLTAFLVALHGVFSSHAWPLQIDHSSLEVSQDALPAIDAEGNYIRMRNRGNYGADYEAGPVKV